MDIALVGRGKLYGLHFYGVLENVASALDKKVDMFKLSEIRPGSPFMKEIKRDGTILCER